MDSDAVCLQTFSDAERVLFAWILWCLFPYLFFFLHFFSSCLRPYGFSSFARPFFRVPCSLLISFCFSFVLSSMVFLCRAHFFRSFSLSLSVSLVRSLFNSRSFVFLLHVIYYVVSFFRWFFLSVFPSFCLSSFLPSMGSGSHSLSLSFFLSPLLKGANTTVWHHPRRPLGHTATTQQILVPQNGQK